ncbi:GyrI-like domain-containing protein [Enterococcus sp. LJL51]|uniref:GyrI-like domain-containing protein n=1 Tax=Enterococcus sp. LJL51 TaxID=3416656 RepID=UPI003CEC63A9
MECRIEKMDAFRVVGVKLTTTTEGGKGMKDIPVFWGEVMEQKQQIQLATLMDTIPSGLLGVSVYNSDANDARVFDYFIACATSRPVPEGMEEYTVPAAEWAVFPCSRENMDQVQVDIFSKWMPASGYRGRNSGYETGYIAAGAPDIEVYTQEGDVEIWVAVEKI